MSKLRVFPAAKLSAIPRPCLTFPAPEMPPRFPTGTLLPQHPPIPVVPQTLSLSAVFGQLSTPPGAGCKGTGSLCSIWKFHFQEFKALALPPSALVVVNLPLGTLSAAECHRPGWIEGGAGSSHQPLGKSSKYAAWSWRTTLPGMPRGAGQGGSGHIRLPPHTPASCPGAQGPWSRCAQLLGDSGVDGPCPSLPPHTGAPSPQAETPGGTDTFSGGRRWGGFDSSTNPCSWEARGCSERGDGGGVVGRSRDRDEGWGGGRAGGDAGLGGTAGLLPWRWRRGQRSVVNAAGLCTQP